MLAAGPRAASPFGWKMFYGTTAWHVYLPFYGFIFFMRKLTITYAIYADKIACDLQSRDKQNPSKEIRHGWIMAVASNCCQETCYIAAGTQLQLQLKNGWIRMECRVQLIKFQSVSVSASVSEHCVHCVRLWDMYILLIFWVHQSFCSSLFFSDRFGFLHVLALTEQHNVTLWVQWLAIASPCVSLVFYLLCFCCCCCCFVDETLADIKHYQNK